MQTKKITKSILTPAKILVIGFFLIISLGTFLLSLPISSVNGVRIPFLNALFTATSATCVTGLTVLDIGTAFSTFGQVVIAMLVQIGGIGFMTMATLIALVLNKRISLRERLILQEALNHGTIDGVVRLVKKVILYSLLVELAGALLLAVHFFFSLHLSLGRSAYFGIFHSISMFNNAGFDLMGTVNGPFSGMVPFVQDPFINIVMMGLIFLGGIGFIVLSDLIDFPNTRKLSLHSKVVLTATLLLIVIGTLVIFAMEFSNPSTLKPLHAGGKFLASMFQSVTTRSGGVATLDIGAFRQSTQFMLILLMFTGAAPGSTGGGIKITTFVLLLGAVYAMIRGREDVVLFRKRIAKDVVYKAITLTLLSLLLIIVFSMLLSITEHQDFMTILFESTSAFGTTGLSMGMTTHLSALGKVWIICLMFFGRIGPLTLVYALSRDRKKDLYNYPEGRIIIG
ncbi:TrkH family potassium uptake protein [Paenibacillus dokdonensis]|uniref:TrkH family potassium uptake protein n=1 Tax=Paenibacillus dokdonensis TaxID=2567944 RepID=A0ABU6GSP5_9BACL|nr:TrkH family potassium uptake protein [Paenibacillus dokdonensis]MEC0242243.1 TrkH family potassium uptake protein [Paenibacillus dokdonensis]